MGHEPTRKIDVRGALHSGTFLWLTRHVSLRFGQFFAISKILSVGYGLGIPFQCRLPISRHA